MTRVRNGEVYLKPTACVASENCTIIVNHGCTKVRKIVSRRERHTVIIANILYVTIN